MDNQSEPLKEMHARQGRSFFGLCDMRRAVIIINSVLAFWTLVEMANLFHSGVNLRRSSAQESSSGDEYNTEDTTRTVSLNRMADQAFRMACWCFLPLFTHALAVAGAVQYNIGFLVPQAILGCFRVASFFAETIIYYVSFRYFSFEYALYQMLHGTILSIFSAYPTVSMCFQIYKGILTKETYHRENFSKFCFGNDKESTDETERDDATTHTNPTVSVV